MCVPSPSQWHTGLQELGCSRAVGLSAWQGAQVGTQRGAQGLFTGAVKWERGAQQRAHAPSPFLWCQVLVFPSATVTLQTRWGVKPKQKSHFQQVMAGSCGAVMRGDVPMQPHGAGTALRLSPRPALAPQGTGSPPLQKTANAKILTEIKTF